MSATLSIALAVYNGERHLPEFLDSILAQTRLPDELVVSDDASTDHTINILKKFSNKAPFPVCIYPNPSNRGVTKNFENAIAKCTGDYIFLADHDDIWLPGKIQKTAGLLINNPRAGAAFCNAQMANAFLKPLGYTIWEALGFSKRKQQSVRAGNALEVFLQYSMIAGMTMAFRSSLRNIILPFPDLPTCHDTCILLMAAAISDVVFTSESLAIHRVHSRNNSGITRKNLYHQYLKAKDQIKNNRLTYSLKLHQDVLEHLSRHKNHSALNPGAERLFLEKITHIKRRKSLPNNKIKRIKVILLEFRNKNYQRFSYGWKSAMQDFFLL